MKKILIVEDEAGLAMSMEDRLQSEGFETVTARDGYAGEKEAINPEYNLILLDVMLPGKDGFQICRSIREKGIKTPVIMLTARNTTIDKVMGLQIGADDYLTKPFEFQELMARIDAQLRRQEMGSHHSRPEEMEIYSFPPFFLNTKKQGLFRRKEDSEEPIDLNSQEYRLLRYFVMNPHRIITRDELLGEVWGYDSITTTRTVDVHISRLRKKFGEHEDFLQTIRGRGYKFEGI